jgi:uncharacterized protein YndB with AHSA1/START domain
LITIAMSTVVGAPRQTVWRALSVPAERVGWDERLLAAIDGVEDYPRAGRLARWRYRLGSVPVVMEDHPLEVVPGERLRSQLGFGHLRIDEIWTLADENGSGDRTRLALRLVASNTVPLVGGLLDRFSVREVAAEIADGRVRQIQKWCETRSPHTEKVRDC